MVGIRALTNSPLGCFLRCLPRQRRSCSNPPLRCFVEVQIKQKLQRHHNAGVLGGRGWTTQAAHLKKPRRGFFPRRTIRRVDAVRIHPHENPNLLQTENRQRISTLTVFLWARVDSNNHGFVPPKPFDSKKLGIMRIFGHPKWNTKPFRPGRNVKSGLQSGLFLGVRGVLG